MSNVVRWTKSFKEQLVPLITGSTLALAVWIAEHLIQKTLPTSIYWLVFLGTFVVASYRNWGLEHLKNELLTPIATALWDSVSRRTNDLVSMYERIRTEYANKGVGPQTEGLPKELVYPLSPRNFVAPYDYWGQQLFGNYKLLAELDKDIEAYNAAAKEKLPSLNLNKNMTMAVLLQQLNDVRAKVHGIKPPFPQ